MLRAVLDANVLASARIRPQGPPGQILGRLVRDSAFELVASRDIFAELRRCLSYPRLRQRIDATDEELDLWVISLAMIADVVIPSALTDRLVSDPDDEEYLAAALEGRASYVVSGDRHLLDLDEYHGVRIVTPRIFLVVLDSQRESADPDR